jgi:predicted Zn-dependent protease
VNEANQSFEAFMFHPDFGNEAVDGRIFFDRWTLFFESDAITIKIPTAQLVVKLGIKTDERIYFSDPNQPGLKILTTDSSILECAAFAQSNHLRYQLQSILGRREIWRRVRVTLYFFAACGLVVWLGSLAAGVMVRSLVKEIPEEWEAKFGDSVMEKAQSEIEFVDDSNQVAQLTALAEPLMSAIPDKNIEFKFHIYRDSFPNAFALPGGHISVSTGLLQMADTPDELLGVIAHESAHITQRHAFRHLISGKGPVFILQIFMGGRSKMLDALAYPSEKLVYESFSQEYEKEADSVGWNYLVAANINPHGMIDMFGKLKNFEATMKVSQKGAAFNSHPALGKRIGWLDEKWDKLPRKDGFMELTNAVPKIEEDDFQNKIERLLQPR